jgi:hypothetical protein
MDSINFGGLLWAGLIIGVLAGIAVLKLAEFLCHHISIGWH